MRNNVTFPRKALVLSVALGTVLGVSACGSDKDEDAAPTTSATSSATSTTTTSSAAPSTTEEEKTEEHEAAPAPEPEAANQENLDHVMQQLGAQEPQAVVGQPASAEDQAAIEALVRGLYEQPTVRSYYSYIPTNSCARALEAYGGATAMDYSVIPDTPLQQWEPFIQAAPRVDYINNITVNGDEASASVASTTEGNQLVMTQRYLRENGQWKFCME